MLEIRYFSVLVAAVMERLHQDPRTTADRRKVPAWNKAAELVREFAIAYVVAFCCTTGSPRVEGS
jgi:hypothetical protein